MIYRAVNDTGRDGRYRCYMPSVYQDHAPCRIPRWRVVMYENAYTLKVAGCRRARIKRLFLIVGYRVLFLIMRIKPYRRGL